jgi:hypothetical protein
MKKTIAILKELCYNMKSDYKPMSKMGLKCFLEV